MQYRKLEKIDIVLETSISKCKYLEVCKHRITPVAYYIICLVLVAGLLFGNSVKPNFQ